MPQRVNSKSDIGTSKIASDSYDTNNIFLTDQGWVYRHWKGDPATTERYWDEIIVAGAVDAADTDNDPVEETVYEVDGFDELNNPIKIPTGSQKYLQTLVTGKYEPEASGGTPDDAFDIEYASHLYDGVASTKVDVDPANERSFEFTQFPAIHSVSAPPGDGTGDGGDGSDA